MIPSHCQLSYEMTAIAPLLPNGQIKFDPNTRTLTIYEESDISLAKTYLVTVTASVENVKSNSIVFVRLVDPCKDPSLTGIKIDSQPTD